MVKRFVYGVYDSTDEAKKVYDALIQKGIPTSAVNIVADEAVIDAFNEQAQNTDNEPTDVTVNVAPTVDTPDPITVASHLATPFRKFHPEDPADSQFAKEVYLNSYKDDIKAGKVLVVVDQAFEAETIALDTTELFASDSPLVDDLQAEALEKRETSDDPNNQKRPFVDLSRSKVSDDTIDTISKGEAYGHAGKKYDKRKNSTAHTVSTRGANFVKETKEVRYDKPDPE
ncbi:hypothetical protein [Fundicoccus culcitae]|uniref:General stress protein 17M-like domain-containing protein n=1 Tax=Fundicoccus culcitae TaxID=2969821 RepID=A0ABY5P4S0_9LACT|nr:hypothetical protein [Fundicoccus culcitae]UUX33694.1 hypothetical protein NRE15_12425 [Fundicoccus culcitae]